MNNNQLQQILSGCLNPNTVNACESQLVQYSRNPNFLTQLLQLVSNQPPELLIMILSTLKNYCTEKYTHPLDQERIPEDQKNVLRSNLFNFFYEINHNQKALNLYKEVLYLVLSQDYEQFQGMFFELLKADMEGSIMASVYFCRQIVRVYEYKNNEHRIPLQYFINQWFPSIEGLTEKIMSNYNGQTSRLLEELLCMFYEAFHIQIPEYLRNFDNFQKWLLYFKTILQAPINDFPNNHFQVSKIYVKITAMYCFNHTDGKKYKGWAAQFRNKYGQNLYEDIIQILINPFGGQDLVANIVHCIYYICRNQQFKSIIQEDHCQHIIYKYLLPFMQSTNEDDQYFYNDGLQYIRRLDDLSCHPFRKSALDLIVSIVNNLRYGQKSELMKLIQYSASVLGSNSSNDRQKQVILIVLITNCINIVELNHIVMKNKYLNENFENLVLQYFVPLLKSANPIVVAQDMRLLSKYLTMAALSTETITTLLGQLYSQMCGNSTVLKYYAILAFTTLIDNKQALQSARSQFKNILQIYVKMLETMDHQNLIKSLSSIVTVFSGEIVQFADNLSTHLFNLFYQMHNKEQQDVDDDEQGFNQITTPLSTIKQILYSPLNPQTYYRISENVMTLLKDINSQYSDYFLDILKLLNVLVYKSPGIVDYEFPYLLSRKLLQGSNDRLFQNNRPNNQIYEIVCAAQKADYQYEDVLLSIIKNLIQKMPDQILHSYPYPSKPQLLLCLIQNKKLSPEALSSLNTSELDSQWSSILQSYTAVVYNSGQVSNPNTLNLIEGISFYPWIEFQLCTGVVKRVLFILADEEEGDDDEFEENTAQLLERYAREDEEEDDIGDFNPDFENGNYSENYDSPFDCKKDGQFLVNKLKALEPGNLQCIIQELPQGAKMKLESLFNQY